MNPIRDLKFHWLLLLLSCGSLVFAITHLNGWTVGIFIVMIFRLVSAKKVALIPTFMILSGLMAFRLYLQNQEMILQKGLFEEGQVQTLQVMVDPLSLRLEEDYFSGMGQVKVGDRMIRMTYQGPITADNDDLMKACQANYYFIECEGVLTYPAPARNFSTFNYRDYLAKQSVIWSLKVKKINRVVRLTDNILQAPWIWWTNIRTHFLNSLRHHDQSILVAIRNKLLFNLESSRWSEIKEVFALLGVLHYFAISGFHIDFIRTRLDSILKRSGIQVGFVRLLVGLVLVLYASLISWPIGVVRSLTLYFAQQVCRGLGWSFSRIDLLAIIGLVLLLYQPHYLFDIGFLLSFLISFILLFYQQTVDLNQSIYMQRLEMTFICLLFTWPITLQISHEWNVLQLVIILGFSYVFDRYMMSGLLFLTLIGFASGPLAFLSVLFTEASALMDWLWNHVPIQSIFNLFTLVHGQPIVWETLLLLSAGIMTVYWLRTKPKQAGLYCLIVYLVVFTSPYLNLSHRVTIIDVGQGDALLYQPAFNQGAWLIDTGGRANWKQGELVDPNFAKRNLLPALKALGVGSLQGVIVTHPDSDHIGNLASLMNRVKVHHLYLTTYTLESDQWRQIEKEIDPRVKVHPLKESQELSLLSGQLELITLSNDPNDPDVSNNSSIISRLQLGPYQVLNMGDLNSDKEAELMDHYPDLRADFLKLGHHGSRHSSSLAFLDHLQVKVGLVSAGENNHYGHPHPEVLDRLKIRSIPYYQTNRQGAIQLEWHPWWGIRLRTALGSKS